MLIEELEIRNIFDCKHLLLSFKSKHRKSIYVVQNNKDPKCNKLFTLAVQLLCSAKYADLRLINDYAIKKNLKEGYVRMKFNLPITQNRTSTDDDDALGELDLQPSTSQAAQKRLGEQRRQAEILSKKYLKIEAWRDFREFPNAVSYSINGATPERTSLAAFHGRFYICCDYLLKPLNNLSTDFGGNWLDLLSSDLNNSWNGRTQFEDPFEKFVSLYRQYGYPAEHILSQITRAHLANTIAIEVLQRSYVVKILRDTRGIFEFISAGEYTVFFYVPHNGRNADVVLDVRVEDINFEYMTTYIQDTSKSINQKYFWKDTQPAVRDMLLISFQIALSFHCKQKIIYLNNFEQISHYQAIQFATTAYFQKLGINRTSWSTKNYLQRIVDACITSGTTAIIEFPGGTPLLPVNAYLMKSCQIVQDGETSLSLRIINEENYSFQYFIEALEQALMNNN